MFTARSFTKVRCFLQGYVSRYVGLCVAEFSCSPLGCKTYIIMVSYWFKQWHLSNSDVILKSMHVIWAYLHVIIWHVDCWQIILASCHGSHRQPKVSSKILMMRTLLLDFVMFPTGLPVKWVKVCDMYPKDHNEEVFVGSSRLRGPRTVKSKLDWKLKIGKQ